MFRGVFLLLPHCCLQVWLGRPAGQQEQNRKADHSPPALNVVKKKVGGPGLGLWASRASVLDDIEQAVVLKLRGTASRFGIVVKTVKRTENDDHLCSWLRSGKCLRLASFRRSH